jgi:protein SCO1/2
MTAIPWRTTALVVLLLLCASMLTAATTHGFSALTSDGVRRADIASTPRPLPALSLRDQQGNVRDLAQSVEGGKWTLATLVYLRCTSICRTSASGQAYLQSQIRSRSLGDRVQLLTLSFDPMHDGVDELRAYARRMRMDPSIWVLATLRDPAQLDRMLRVFDIVVIPDGLGGYSHNAALFVIDPQGRVVLAHDVDDPGGLQALLARMRVDDGA